MQTEHRTVQHTRSRETFRVYPLGGTHEDYDPYFVGCFPDPFFESLFGGFGCGYSADSKCPPGYEEVYGNPRPDRRGGPAIATINSLHDYANAVLTGGSGYGTNYTFTNTPNGVDFWISSDWINSLLGEGEWGRLREDITGTLTSLDDIRNLAEFIAAIESAVREAEAGDEEKKKCKNDCIAVAVIHTAACLVFSGPVLAACIVHASIELYFCTAACTFR